MAGSGRDGRSAYCAAEKRKAPGSQSLPPDWATPVRAPLEMTKQGRLTGSCP
jgi:hypothetical protein